MNRLLRAWSHLSDYLYKCQRIQNRMPDKMFLKHFFVQNMGYYMDFHKPKTFNEKLQWLKLYDRNPLYTKLVDKHLVKAWVADIIGEEHIIPTLAIYNNVEDIDITLLPNQFVLKCTHDSGSVVVCTNREEFTMDSINELKNALNSNYYLLGREWPYKNVVPRIISEPYISDSSGHLLDYKFFCFNGKVKLFKIDIDRTVNHRANYYNREGSILPFGEILYPPDFDRKIEIPSNLSQMIEFAERISDRINTPFVRIDFYDVDGLVLFGEITFYPASGHGKFTDSVWDEILGSWIKI